MATTTSSTTLATLRAQQTTQPLSLLSLAEPLLTSQSQSQTQPQPSHPRTSDTFSTTTTTTTTDPDTSLLPLTPATLAADLSHYKDLFSKLRFSYLEQVTKEKYLRSIVGDPPLLVRHEDNLLLEEKLAEMKMALKGKKDEVELLVKEMEGRAREVAGLWEGVGEGIEGLEGLPGEIEELRGKVEALQGEMEKRRREEGKGSEDPRMNLSLVATEQALREQRERNEEVDRQIAELERQMPSKVREVERMDRELGELERKRNEATRLAVEGRRRREEGGRDEMEELGRWYRASEGVLKGLLGVEG